VKNEKSTSTVGFKGFDKNMKCRGFQYEVGKKYETESVKVCHEGFHLCEYPLDVFIYYPPADSRFAMVAASGKTDKDGEDSKLACTNIEIQAELTIAGVIEAAVKFVFERVKKTKLANNKKDRGAASNSGYRGAASNSGDSGAASNSGDSGAASNSGDSGAASNSGYRGAASNSGYSGAASNSGDSGAASNSGDRGAASNSGYSGAASNSGYSGAASNSGYRGAASNSGYRGAASNSGYSGAAFSNGFESSASTEGEESVAVNVGINGKAKAKKGLWIVVSEWTRDAEFKWHRVGVKSAQIDGKILKEDIFYKLKNGEFVEA